MNELTKAFSRTKAIMNAMETVARKKNVKGFRTSMGTIRMDVVLTNTGNIIFQPNQTAQQNQITTETRLRQGDSFLPSKIRLSIRKAATNDAAGNIVSVLHQFPNSTIFTAASEAANLEAMFNAQMVITINSVALADYMETNWFRRVGIAQQGVVLSQLAVPVTPAAYLQNQWDSPDYGFVDFQQDLCFNGKQTNSINMVFPGSPAVTLSPASGSTVNFGVVMMRGVLCQNGSDFITDESIHTFYKEGGVENRRMKGLDDY